MSQGKRLSSFFLSDFTLKRSTVHFILLILFFFSGGAALTYQVMWQRMLFTVFGVDLISVSIIVSVFMFGLGMGGLLGGYLADKMVSKLLGLYIAIEFLIALFGFCSPRLIELLGDKLFASSELTTLMVSFLLLAFPTILMGATFPVLVTHVNLSNQNIGRSVGSLYFANTLGGAFGAYFSGFILLYSLDLVDVVNRAAVLNLMVGLVALLMFRRRQSC